MKTTRSGGVAALAVLLLAGCSSPELDAASQPAISEQAEAAQTGGDPPIDPRIRDLSGFALFSARDLAERDQGLTTRIGPDFSARETLADYGNHRFRFIRRSADGAPEQHDEIIDVVMVHSGEGVLLLGGRLVDPESASPGEWRGSAIEGGERHPIGPGDVMHIPATVPHSFLVPPGQHLTYVLVKFPAP